jgi:hypothetical protein
MRSPALAMAWELWGRNRPGITAVLLGVVGFALLGVVLGVSLEPSRARAVPVFVWSVILFAVAYLYLISITLYGEIRTGAFFSAFPARMFTLPVRTSLLVFGPMFFGVTALVFLWFACALLIWLPAGADVQWWVLPLLAVALAWFQAVCWAVPGPPLAKVLAACVIFPAVKFALEMMALAVAWFGYEQPRLDREALIAARILTLTIFCTTFLPLAYAVAVWGVARDRRGTYQGWSWFERMIEHARGWLPKRRGRFASGAHAQLWYEWRRKGLILPMFPFCFLLFVTVVVAPFVRAQELFTLVVVLACMVPIVAFFVGYGLGKTAFWGGDLSFTSLQATRPLSSAALAMAKLHLAALSALATWGLLLLAIPLWLVLLGRLGEMAAVLEPYFRAFATLGLSPFQVYVLAAIGFFGLWALTWGQLVAGLCLSLTGRAWVVNGAVAFYIVLESGFFVMGQWVYARPDEFESVVTMLSWCLGGLAGVKLLGAGWALAAAQRRGLWEWRSLAIVLGLWIFGVSCLLTLLYRLVPAEGLPLAAEVGPNVNRLPVHLLALAAVLALPLVRLSAAPLALAWNRHR